MMIIMFSLVCNIDKQNNEWDDNWAIIMTI